MPTLYIDELEGIAGDGRFAVQAAAYPPIAQQPVAFSASVGTSDAFNAATRVIRVWSDTECMIAIGANPAPGPTTTPMAEKTPEYFSVRPGQKIAAVTR